MGKPEAERNEDSHQVRRRGKKFRVMAGTLVIGLVGSVSGVLFEYLWAKPRFEQPLPGAVAPTLTSTRQSPGTGDVSRRCRTFADARHAPVEIAPCIARAGDQLEISARVMSRETTEVIVHVWLHDSGTNSHREYTLKSCRLTVARGTHGGPVA